MIREMAARKAIILSTHILDEMEAVCTRAIHHRQGAHRGRRHAPPNSKPGPPSTAPSP